MILGHTTSIRKLRGAERRNLLCYKSRGKRPVVWLHTPAKSFWAALHTVRRHGGRVEAVVILLVDDGRGAGRHHSQDFLIAVGPNDRSERTSRLEGLAHGVDAQFQFQRQ
jgi:hypothetical protein